MDTMTPNLTVSAGDEQALLAAFAEHVAGWTYWQSKHGHFHVTAPDGGKSEPAYGWPAFDESTGAKIERKWTDGLELPPFTTSADAVMIHLDNWRTESPTNRIIEITLANNCGAKWQVTLGDEGEETREAFYFASHASLPLAILLALLKAHGVTVTD